MSQMSSTVIRIVAQTFDRGTIIFCVLFCMQLKVLMKTYQTQTHLKSFDAATLITKENITT